MKPTNRVVLFEGGRATLLLSDITRDDAGRLKAGWVDNGCWRFEISDGEVLAREYWHKLLVNRWPDPGYIEVPVKPEWRGDYNAVMAKAQEEYDANH
ncbi:hypothetical protein WK72_14480 [Burkholderia ubonensis]|uniref:hypothetical protein n=1 Tax=Burkholderia ubonensis TaxID=101571 RepID=UPI000753CD86|nr:hypothetical protein [Burkholderia ubonensis]KVU68926.1 hypothetical protein WK72_14480 [Burkholderia ubonensis]KWH15615.1 hypothetical protein WL97_16385 [Burkholderia ubonensis]